MSKCLSFLLIANCVMLSIALQLNHNTVINDCDIYSAMSGHRAEEKLLYWRIFLHGIC